MERPPLASSDAASNRGRALWPCRHAEAAWPWAAHAQQAIASQTAIDDNLFAHFYDDPQPARLVGFLEGYANGPLVPL
jgi:hypothetical protein